MTTDKLSQLLTNYLPSISAVLVAILALTFLLMLLGRYNNKRSLKRFVPAMALSLLALLFVTNGISDFVAPLSSNDAVPLQTDIAAVHEHLRSSIGRIEELERELSNTRKLVVEKTDELERARLEDAAQYRLLTERASLRQEIASSKDVIEKLQNNLAHTGAQYTQAIAELEYMRNALVERDNQLSDAQEQLEAPAIEGTDAIISVRKDKDVMILPGYGSIVTVVSERGDHEKAAEYYRNLVNDEVALKIFPAGTAIAYENLARLTHSTGEKDKAREYHDKALDLATEVGQPAAAFINAYDMLGLSWLLNQELERAGEYEAYATRIAKELEYEWGIGGSALNRGVLSYLSGDTNKAEEEFLEALEVFRRNKYSMGTMMTLYNLVALAMRTSAPDKVKTYDSELQKVIETIVASK